MRRRALIFCVVVGTLALPTHVSANPAPDVSSLSSHVLSLEEIRQASGTSFPALALLDNPSLPNGCRQPDQDSLKCTYSLVGSPFTPDFPSYPFSLMIDAHTSSTPIEWEFRSIRSYRPEQEGVVGILRDDAERFALGYSHSWGSDSVFAMERRGRYLVQTHCTAKRGAASFEELMQCAEAVTSAQLQRLEQPLPAFTPPGVPRDVIATVRGSTASVRWSAPDDNGGLPITGYQVLDANGSVACSIVNPTLDGLSCDVRNVAPGRLHTYSVVSMNDVGVGPASEPATTFAARLQPPTPTKIRVKTRQTTARVSWTVPKSMTDFTDRAYRVTANPGGPSCETKKTTCTVRGLEEGQVYTFRVLAIADGKPSEPATSKAVRMPAPPRPVAPPTPPPPKPEQQLS